MDSSGRMTCALKVDTQTGGWHKSLIKVLKNIDGVTYSIDAQQGIAYISGKVDPGKLLKLLAKSGKHAELCWVDSGNNHQDIAAAADYKPFNKIHFNNAYKYYHPYDTNNYYYDHPYQTDQNRDNYYYYYYFDDADDDDIIHHHQKSWYSYPDSLPFHEPPARYFPQPPKPMEGFNVGEPELCTIM